MKIHQIIPDWRNYIAYEQGLAKSSLATYSSNLNRYVKFLAESGLVDPEVGAGLSTQNLRKYLYHLQKLNLKGRSIHGAFDAVESFITFCLQNGLLDSQPMQSIKLPPKGAARRELVSDAEVAALFEAASRQYCPRDVARSRAILSLLCYTGVRISELIAICTDDLILETDEPLVIVRHGKGDKSRSLYLSQACAADLHIWMAEREKMSCSHSFLICKTAQRCVSDEWIRLELNRLKAAAGLGGHTNISPHSLRHWFASNIHRHGASLKTCQMALGHSDIATTAVYIHGSLEDAKSMAKFAQLGKDALPGSANPPEKIGGSQPQPINRQSRSEDRAPNGEPRERRSLSRFQATRRRASPYQNRGLSNNR